MIGRACRWSSRGSRISDLRGPRAGNDFVHSLDQILRRAPRTRSHLSLLVIYRLGIVVLGKVVVFIIADHLEGDKVIDFSRCCLLARKTVQVSPK